MNFLEVVDPLTGKKTRREMHPSKYQLGKSREQGPMGASQGAQGWRAQYGDAVGRLLGGITAQNDTPKFTPITHSLLTNEGYNQALQNVYVRNLQKLAAQRRQALVGALGSLLRHNAAINTARIGAASRMYATDKDFKAKTLGLEEQRRYHDLLNSYNRGMLQNQQERLRLEREKLTAPQNPRPINPLDAAIKRAKIVPDASTFKALIPDREIADEIGSKNLKKARMYYIQTGKMPKFEKESGFFDDYAPIPPGQKPAPKITKDHILSVRSEIAKDFGVPEEQIAFDPKRKMYVLPNGYDVPLNKAYERVFGDR